MRFIALLLASLFLASGAYAQTTVQQALPMLNAATGLYGQANGATSCNAVSQTAAQDTVTVTPPAGQFVYVTMVAIQNYTDATGATQVGTISSTNLTGAPFWSQATTLNTTAGMQPMLVETYPTALKSTVPGTAVTFVPSATQSAHNIMCMRVAAFFGP